MLGAPYVFRLVLALASIFKPVIWVNNENFNPLASDKEFRPFENSVNPEIAFGGYEEEICFKVLFHLFVLPVCQVFFIKLFARELLNQF